MSPSQFQQPADDRHSSTAMNIVDAAAVGIQLVFELAGVVIEGVVSLLVGLLG